MSVTADVSNNEMSRVVRELHLKNIYFIDRTEDVSNTLKSRDVNEEQFVNI